MIVTVPVAVPTLAMFDIPPHAVAVVDAPYTLDRTTLIMSKPRFDDDPSTCKVTRLVLLAALPSSCMQRRKKSVLKEYEEQTREKRINVR